MTVLGKDYNGQVDWWICQLRGQVGMVPANYFEIFHDQDHDPTTYDTPRSARTTPIPPPQADESLYDFPPSDQNDYDMPPLDRDAPDYDRPPSSNRSSMKSGSTWNRLSQASAASSNSLYDVPPDIADVYDFPKANPPLIRAFEEERPLIALDINSMHEDKAEELLSNYRQNISATYESLFQTVYGPDAYWGSDNKTKRSLTLQKTVTATKHLDHSLRALLEFGKGVVNSLEGSSDANFKKKHTSAFRSLLQKKHDIMTKLESLSSEIDSITATVKSLLEVARTIPSAVTEFTVLVQANKALLFTMSPRDTGALPVITKNEVKSRPLPDLPPPAERRDSLDYASIMTVTTSNGYASAEITPDGPAGIKPDSSTPRRMSDETSLDWGTASRKRNPNDSLPPLPGATIPRRTSRRRTPDLPPRVLSPLSSLRSDMRSPLPPRSRSRASDIDYDDIPEAASTVHAPVRGNRPSTGSGASRGASPRPYQSPHHVRRQSLSSMSGSSDELNSSGMRRCQSEDLLDGPYGRAVMPNGGSRSASPQLPLRQEDRDMLQRFSKQMDLIVPTVSESIDTFLECLKDGEPPFDFVTKSKLTVVASYKLVYIADALSQNILHNETKSAILASSNRLTESIKNLVCDTKTAALQYPSVIALDRMGESLRKLFPAALELVDSVRSPPTLV